MDLQTALAVFAAAGRLVDPDPEAPIVLVNGEETILPPARLITAATMMLRRSPQILAEQRQGIVPPAEKPDVRVEAERYEVPDVEEAYAMLEIDDSIASDAGKSDQTESEVKRVMNFHICTDGRRKIAGKDGYCSKCRPVEEPAKLSHAPQEPQAQPAVSSRRERIEAARSEKTIILNWIDEGAMRQLTLGANVPENRSLAGRIQQARKSQNLKAMVSMVGSEHIAGTILASPKLFYKLVS
jgi:hypothetical protein